MSSTYHFYICPVCFEACDSRRDCHDHAMICCDEVKLGDERCKPVVDATGRMVSRAPRWFLEAAGWIRVESLPATDLPGA